MRVPAGTCVLTDAKIGVGEADVPDRSNQWIDISITPAEPPADAPARKLLVNADIGVGHLQIDNADRGLHVKRGRADRTLIVAGLATIALGALLLLDRTGVIDVRFDYMVPAVLAAVGAVLLAAGLFE